MPRDSRGLLTSSPAGASPRSSASIQTRPGDGRTIVAIDDVARQQLDLPPGAILSVDRDRRPSNGDLVLVELVRHGSTQRLVRRFAFSSGWVTLTVADEATPAIMRRHGELLVLGVVDVEPATEPPASPAPR